MGRRFATAASVTLVVGCGTFGSTVPPSTNDAGASTDAGANADATADAAIADATTTTNLGVFCETEYCTPGVETCCYNAKRYCAPLPVLDPSTCVNPIACDDVADCEPSTVCCGSFFQTAGDLRTSQCLRLADCQKKQTYAVLCDPLASPSCPEGSTCERLDGAGYAVCSGLVKW